jgi:hypothetical protein
MELDERHVTESLVTNGRGTTSAPWGVGLSLKGIQRIMRKLRYQKLE